MRMFVCSVVPFQFIIVPFCYVPLAFVSSVRLYVLEFSAQDVKIEQRVYLNVPS